VSTPALEKFSLAVDAETEVDALLQRPSRASACYVFAHGAGAGMTHAFMQAVADGLAARNVATLRYQFPYMQRHSRRRDAPALAHATVRAACRAAAERAPDLALFAGGKSFGGRMTSQAQAAAPLAGVKGLVFVGFPLHPPEKPSDTRAAHLAEVALPMLFLQGTRDELAERDLLVATVERLGARATLVEFDGADHTFHVLKRSGRTDAEVLNALLDALAGWIALQH
jgi:predicted alpha/beta-hydrolase family hydrolase